MLEHSNEAHSWCSSIYLLIYLKVEFDLSTLVLVAGMPNNISKTFVTLGNILPICFSLMTETVWDRDFTNDRTVWDRDFGFSFFFPNIVSIVSIPVEKLLDLEGIHCNILIQTLHVLL